MNHYTKRYLVIDLFSENNEIIEWVIACKNNPDKKGKYKVKLHNGNIIDAFYFPNEGWISRVNQEDSPITHWRRVK